MAGSFAPIDRSCQSSPNPRCERHNRLAIYTTWVSIDRGREQLIAVHNWLQQFTSYSNVDVIIDVTPGFNIINQGTATVTGAAVYQGTQYASASASWDNSGVGNGCTDRVCPIQP